MFQTVSEPRQPIWWTLFTGCRHKAHWVKPRHTQDPLLCRGSMETQLGVSIRAGRAEHSLSSSHSGLMGFGLMQQHKFLNSECTATLPGFWDYKKRNLNSPSETITYWKSSSFAFPHSARRSKNIFTSLYPSLVFFWFFGGAILNVRNNHPDCCCCWYILLCSQKKDSAIWLKWKSWEKKKVQVEAGLTVTVGKKLSLIQDKNIKDQNGFKWTCKVCSLNPDGRLWFMLATSRNFSI